MKKLDGSNELINSTTSEIMSWAEEMAKKGLYELNTSRHLRTALKALVGVLDPDEPADPNSLLANLDQISERWARVNKANPSTMKTYRQRASALLEDYVSFMENPASFKGRGGNGAP